jgi:hypothetical protein
MLYDERQLKELNRLKHMHDSNKEYADYEKTILKNSLSSNIFKNDLMNSFLNKLQPLLSKLFDQMNIIKNFQNYMVDKYYYKHDR